MAYEDFTTYDEVDEGNDITVIASKVSWSSLLPTHHSYVSVSKGANHFDDDFEHLFEVQLQNGGAVAPAAFWALANSQDCLFPLEVDDADFVIFFHSGSTLILRVYEDGEFIQDAYGGSASVTYYITLSRDDDGGTNNTGQYVAEIRTGSHAGVLVDTLTVDCGVDEQNDFEFIYGLMGLDNPGAGSQSHGFTQNLDLQEEAPPTAGIMTTNTGYWGAI